MITVERIGRRSYLRGDTFPIKAQLREAGAKWDPDLRGWWLSKHEAATALAEAVAHAAAQAAVRGVPSAAPAPAPKARPAARPRSRHGRVREGERYCCSECDEFVIRAGGSYCWETGISH
jgi:hypothetical protein